MNKIYKYIVIIAALTLGIAVRAALFEQVGYDYITFLLPWYNFIKTHGGWHALRYNFSDYNVPYLYLLTLLTYIPVPPLFGIKAISVLFDLIIAFYAYKIVQVRYKSAWIPLVCGIIVFLLPSVIANSSHLGQCDSIYTAFCVGCIYYLLVKRPVAACTMLGLALSFKLQTVFVLPIVFFLCLKRQIDIRYIAITVLTYGLLLVPAVLLGRSVQDLVLVYKQQAMEYHCLTCNAPNIYQWLPEHDSSGLLALGGMVVTAGLVLLLAGMVWRRGTAISPSQLVGLTLLCTLFVPFFLPHMHDRYFYLAEICSVVYAFYFPKRLYVAILVQIVSVCVYFTNELHANIRYAALGFIPVMVIVAVDVYKQFHDEPLHTWLPGRNLYK